MSDIAPEVEMSHWTGERIARLGFLVGIGWDAERIAHDPIVAAHPNNVHRQVQRFGLSFRAASVAISVLPLDIAAYFDGAAFKRGIARDALIRNLLIEIAANSNLLDNILDDEPLPDPPK
jgi:hypothetical protein